MSLLTFDADAYESDGSYEFASLISKVESEIWFFYIYL